MVAVERRAPAAGRTLVAGRERRVVEVRATGALHEVAADGRHVAQLRRGAGNERLREQRIPLSDEGMIGRVAVAHQCADANAAVGQRRDGIEAVVAQMRDVDEFDRPLDPAFH
jgi:hypothetical protein